MLIKKIQFQTDRGPGKLLLSQDLTVFDVQLFDTCFPVSVTYYEMEFAVCLVVNYPEILVAFDALLRRESK